MFAGTGAPIPPQDAAQVLANWPAGEIGARMANYLCQAQQKWSLTAVPNVGGYPGSPYFKITIAGTDRALAATDLTGLSREVRQPVLLLLGTASPLWAGQITRELAAALPAAT